MGLGPRDSPGTETPPGSDPPALYLSHWVGGSKIGHAESANRLQTRDQGWAARLPPWPAVFRRHFRDAFLNCRHPSHRTTTLRRLAWNLKTRRYLLNFTIRTRLSNRAGAGRLPLYLLAARMRWLRLFCVPPNGATPEYGAGKTSISSMSATTPTSVRPLATCVPYLHSKTHRSARSNP
jgi:hypothetical protein